MNFYLVMVDTAQIQPYVFGSNRLRENVGASYLVAQATDEWSRQAAQAAASGRTNLDAEGKIDPAKRIEDATTNIAAEVAYAGGGNFAVIFRDEGEANDFTRRLSGRALEEAPGLQLVIAREGFDWDDQGIGFDRVLDAVIRKLAVMKRARPMSAALLGLGVTAVCGSTGLPAVGWTPKVKNDEGSVYLASSGILAKIANAMPQGRQPSAANRRLNDLIPQPEGYVYPNDFDEMGRSRGEHSFIAVVHADGNQMGQRIRRVAEQHGGDKRQCIEALRDLSDRLNRAGLMALRDSVEKLGKRIDGHGNIVHRNAVGEVLAQITLERDDEDEKWRLPFRPLVFGGDDVTFVCDGRLGIALAAEFLFRFERHTSALPDGAGAPRAGSACAGIAIVKSHYPFARAYALAEELCHKAKTFCREENLDASCFDWHFALSGLADGIEAIREREYEVPAGKLYLRPVTLHRLINHERHSWSVVEKGIQAFQDLSSAIGPDEKPKWSNRRNKVKALREALRGGKDAAEKFSSKFNRTEHNPEGLLPEVEPTMTNWPRYGWQEKVCGYFDAIELVDAFIPLDKSGLRTESEVNADGTATDAQQ